MLRADGSHGQTVADTMSPSHERTRDVHALDADGMIACNPRDPEAAHRAEVGGIATAADPAEITCRRCIAALRL